MKVRAVKFAAGFGWIQRAAALFFAEPLRWLGLLSLWMLISLSLFALAPPLGLLIMLILQPIWFGGLVLAVRDQEAGLPLRMMHLYAAFGVNGRALALVAFFNVLIELAAFLPLVYLGFPINMPMDANQQADVNAYMELLNGKESLVILGFASSVFIKSLFWFAVPLLVLQPMPASHALRWSFYAWIENFLPMMLFSFVGAVLFLLASATGVGLFIFFPLYAIAHYTSYREVFEEG